MASNANFTTFIRSTGQMCGIEHLDANVVSALAPDLEYRLREIIQEAVKFMKHSKRAVLHPKDVTQALQVRERVLFFPFFFLPFLLTGAL